MLIDKEVERKKKAEELFRAMVPSEQDVASRIIQALFTDNENEHKVKKKQSVLVSSSQ